MKKPKCTKCNHAIKKPSEGFRVQKANTIVKELWIHRACKELQDSVV